MWTSDLEGFKRRIECSCLCCIYPLNHTLNTSYTKANQHMQPTGHFITDKQGGEQVGLLPPHFPKPCLGAGWLHPSWICCVSKSNGNDYACFHLALITVICYSSAWANHLWIAYRWFTMLLRGFMWHMRTSVILSEPSTVTWLHISWTASAIQHLINKPYLLT